jgi:Raf kinase inhibitor-like YbhB/YbcL family protein
MKPRTVFAIIGVITLCIGALFFTRSARNASTSEKLTNTSMLKITSSAFTHGQPIPKKYTCDGEDAHPPLSISEIPSGTKSFALIVDDPDAPGGTWTHWVVWNIDPGIISIDENVLPHGAEIGINDFEQLEYGGPCPPRGTPHRYFFKLYALDTMLGLSRGSSKELLEAAIEGHILDHAELIGTYAR